MEVYLVVYGIEYEGEQLLGVFSSLHNAKNKIDEYTKQYGISETEWLIVRKAEVDRDYGIGEIGEEVIDV